MAIAHAADAAQIWMRRIDPTGRLTSAERSALEAVLCDQFAFKAREVLAAPGAPNLFMVLLLQGLLGRVKVMANGERQIVSVLTPGDLCTCGLALVLPMDYALVALSDGRAAHLTVTGIEYLQRHAPHVMLPVGRTLAEDAAVTREWVANVGAREGPERVAHFLCELRWRLEAVGAIGQRGGRLPIGQRDIAEAVGLSRVQVNRVLQRLRKAGLVEVERGAVEILDPEGLAATAEFDPHYLEARETAARAIVWRGFQLSS
jgi:CRP-like cAMP-binding protein